MVTRVIRTEADIEALHLLVKARKLPFTVEVTMGETKTTAQNRLQRQWCTDGGCASIFQAALWRADHARRE